MGTPAYGTTPGMLPYLNFARGIRIDYPGSWTVQEQSSPVSFAVRFGSPPESPSDVFQENLVLQVQPVFPETTQDSFVQSWQAMAQQASLQVLETAAATLAGRTAFRAVFLTPLAAPVPLQGKVLSLFCVCEGAVYTAAYTAQQDHYETFLPTVFGMLSTLQLPSLHTAGMTP